MFRKLSSEVRNSNSLTFGDWNYWSSWSNYYPLFCWLPSTIPNLSQIEDKMSPLVNLFHFWTALLFFNVLLRIAFHILWSQSTSKFYRFESFNQKDQLKSISSWGGLGRWRMKKDKELRLRSKGSERGFRFSTNWYLGVSHYTWYLPDIFPRLCSI